ncbi:hypothetical protein SERLA73DRAFT_17432, partial [Serpula lacrymans var. lacrymans S7.3]
SIIATAQAVAEEQKQQPQPRPYHNSILTGYGWVRELMDGYPDQIRTELGMWREIFVRLINFLQSHGYTDSKHAMLEKPTAIFLYACITSLST